MLQRINDELVFIQANTLLSNERVEEMQDISELDRLFEDISGIKDIKMNIRFYNDTTVLLRLHNLNDYKVVKTVLYR